MADADEDIIPRSQPSTSAATSQSADPTFDLEDEAQDFRFLASLTGASKTKQSSNLPKRGEKDFEPNLTQAQSDTLHASREAMHNVLSVERVLVPHNQLVGQYLPHDKDWRYDVATHRVGGGGRCVVVEKFHTVFSRSFGSMDYRNWTWLLPEEALFLIERGTLDIRWPDQGTREFEKGKEDESETRDESAISTSEQEKDQDDCNTDDEQDKDSVAEANAELEHGIDQYDNEKSKKKQRISKYPVRVGELPMSLQGAYASFIGKSGLTLERYNVYAGLRRLGYIVHRAPSWNDDDDNVDDDERHDMNGDISQPNGHIVPSELRSQSTLILPTSRTSTSAGLIQRLFSFLFTPRPPHYRPSTGPLIYPGIYRSYNDIFRALKLIPFHTSTSDTDTETISSQSKPKSKPRPKPPYNAVWHVHKPANSPSQPGKYRKADPPPPDFRVAVVDARTTTTVPTMAQLGVALDDALPDELPRAKKMEARMKHGARHVIVAVVDCGVVSYLRFADICSGTEAKVFETHAPRGSKGRGGGVGGKGRGRGRGRGGGGRG